MALISLSSCGPRRARLAVLGLTLVGAAAQAQTVAPNVALPFYSPTDFMQGVYRNWYAPQSAGFANEAAKLPVAVSALCDASAGDAPAALKAARAQWQATAVAWDSLSGVAVGPLVERRSVRQIDFTPTRPELIERAIRAAPSDAAAMERIGTPAKGLPALEWLLWTRPATPNSPACTYAVQVATDITREATVLAQAFAELATRERAEDEEEATVPAMGELVNQWVGGLERLRWAEIERPVRSAGQGGRNAPVFPCTASGSTAATWAAHWLALRTLAVASSNDPAVPGMGLAPLESYLRGRGLNAPAEVLAQSVRRADSSLQGLSPAEKNRLLPAAARLAELKRVVEAEIAPALQVNIGFSDADGD